MRRWLHRAIALVLVGTLAACSAHPTPRRTAAASVSPVVHALHSVEHLAATFDRDREHPRIVLLLSPT